MSFELSVLIPARNEMFLQNTIDDVLKNSSDKTEIIVVLDGYWPDEGIPQHPRVTVIHHEESIGQRAATNEAARISMAKYIMKLDAHCAMDKGFDEKLIKAVKELGKDVMQVPLQRNLHVFDWQCDKCGWKRYQGPLPKKCEKCGHDKLHRKMVWKPRGGTRTTYWVFDSELHFQYGKRPKTKDEFEETMSLLGACWFMTRERYWEIDGLDERHGSYGQMGTELACKSWLSGGRVITNKKTYFSHLFRTRQDFGFPYPISGNQVSRARKHSKNLWRKNAWPKQVRPLSWMLDHFWPVKGWSDDARAVITEAGVAFSAIRALADSTRAHETSTRHDHVGSRKGMSVDAVSLPRVDCGYSVFRSEDVGSVADQSQVSRVATGAVITGNVIDNGDVTSSACRQLFNKPSVDDSMNQRLTTTKRNPPVTSAIQPSIPNPAISISINSDSAEDPRQGLAVEVGNREILSTSHDSSSNDESRLGKGDVDASSVPTIIPRKGILYYSDCKAPEHILKAVRNQLTKITAECDMPIMAVTLSPVDFGTNVVVPLERGYLTMFKQILVGLELIDADVVFFCEHDVLYSPTHFDFTPERDDLFYYNENVWKVDANDGKALFYYAKQTSGLCAKRELLLKHYRKRVEIVEKNGFTRRMGFEPGTHGRAEKVDDFKSEAWMSEVPNIDIRHGKNLTPSRWRQDQFRNQRSCRGWKESDGVPGWSKTRGRFDEFLREAIE